MRNSDFNLPRKNNGKVIAPANKFSGRLSASLKIIGLLVAALVLLGALYDRYRLSIELGQSLASNFEAHLEMQQIAMKLTQSTADNESLREQLQSVRMQYLTRLSRFAEFENDDPALARSLLVEAQRFAVASKINASEIIDRLATMPDAQSLPSDSRVRILSVEHQPTFSTIDVSISDEGQKFLDGLSRIDFVVESRGITVHPVRVEQSSLSLGKQSISLLLDCSSSIAGQAFTELKSASKSFVRQLADPWKLRVIRFASDVQAVSPWTHDADVHTAAIDRLIANGATSLLESLRLDALELSKLDGTRSTILFTDGRDSGNQKTIDPTLKLYRDNSIRVYVIALDQSGIDEQLLRRIATETGGTFQKISDAKQLQKSFAAIAQNMKTPVYQLTLLQPFDQDSLSLSVSNLPPIKLVTQQLASMRSSK